VAVVPLFQILATAALGSAIFTTIHRRGVPLLLLMPWYAFFVLSVPIGLYTISLWKDIPFALLVLLWAFYLAQRVYLGKEPVDRARSGRELGWYLLALAGIGLFRYNGLVYLFFIPLGFVLFRLVSVRRALLALAVLAVAGAVNLAALAALDKGDYFFGSIRFFTHRLQEEAPDQVARRMFRQYPELLDINSYKRTGTWYDIWYRNPVFIAIHEDFTRESGYNLHVRHQEVKPISGRLFKWLNRFAHGSYQEPWVWFTWNPYYLIFLAPLCCLPWWFPSTAAFGYVIFVQVLTLMLVLGPYNYNWRYYYFFYLSLPFFVPMALMDRWHRRILKEGVEKV
jgi:hypothetical protein